MALHAAHSTLGPGHREKSSLPLSLPQPFDPFHFSRLKNGLKDAAYFSRLSAFSISIHPHAYRHIGERLCFPPFDTASRHDMNLNIWWYRIRMKICPKVKVEQQLPFPFHPFVTSPSQSTSSFFLSITLLRLFGSLN